MSGTKEAAPTVGAVTAPTAAPINDDLPEGFRAKPLSGAHLRAAAAAWRCRVEGMGETWSEDLLVPDSVMAEVAAAMQTLLEPSPDMVHAMIGPIMERSSPAGALRPVVAGHAAVAVIEVWCDGMRAALGLEPRPRRPLVIHPGGHS